MVDILSFLNNNPNIVIKKHYDKYIFYLNNLKVGELTKLQDSWAFIKEVDLERHRGKGQYYIYYNMVGTAKDVIDYIESKFKGFEVVYCVKLLRNRKFLGYIVYDWYYYRKYRKLNQEPGYELQYVIEIPQEVIDKIGEYLESGKKFMILISEEGIEEKIKD